MKKIIFERSFDRGEEDCLGYQNYNVEIPDLNIECASDEDWIIAINDADSKIKSKIADLQSYCYQLSKAREDFE